MKKIVLVDGNNLLFRSYYATAYAGNMMNNSGGFPTNALYGFVNMMNKIIKEEEPHYILVAFDKGKTFRHEKYDFYKDGRAETPNELLKQFPKAKEVLDGMGIRYLEVSNYEADDIIGTFSTMANVDTTFDALIVSSDKDLLQLIKPDVNVKLLKSKDFILMNEETFKKEYGIDPIKMIDLKALMGDPSDNIPGVKGVGEKTALKLLQDYGSLDGVYLNIDKISGKLKEKLEADKEKAYISYEMATIVKDVPVGLKLDDVVYSGINKNKLIKIYEELEFYSYLKDLKTGEVRKETKTDVKVIKVESIDEIELEGAYSLYIESFEDNYHRGEIYGAGIYDGKKFFYINKDLLPLVIEKFNNYDKLVYDYKKNYVLLNKLGVELQKVTFDLLTASYILEYNIKNDIAYIMNQFNENVKFIENIFDNKSGLIIGEEEFIDIIFRKAKFIYDIKDNIIGKLKDEEQYDLYNNIELPLSLVLADMEIEGVLIDKEYIKKQGEEIKIKMSLIEMEIYNMCGEEFNILSPKQLGDILFNKLKLKHGKKLKSGFSTNSDVLEKLKNSHPVVKKILEYRTLSKLYSNYVVGLLDLIYEDGKVHTMFNQTLTRTGRLSSTEPNLQNIPIREEYGRLIRKGFIPDKGSMMMSFDYSQIELRILAHLSKSQNLIDAFERGLDIHTKTASDIFGIDIKEVTKDMRNKAKAVNFGIIYGISGFGLSENLNIDIKEAQKFIDLYMETFPGVRKFQEDVIKEAYDKGYVKTLMNRKRSVPELKNKNYMIRKMGERIALNAPIQGTNADIIKLAMVKIFEEFNKKKLKSKMIIQVHDELIFDVEASEVGIIEELVTEIMENVYKLNVPIKVDMEVGNNWYEAK